MLRKRKIQTIFYIFIRIIKKIVMLGQCHFNIKMEPIKELIKDLMIY